MKLTCRIGLHELDWEDRVLRTRYGKAVQRGSCRHCGLIKQRFLTLSEHDSDSVPEDIETRATGPLPRHRSAAAHQTVTRPTPDPEVKHAVGDAKFLIGCLLKLIIFAAAAFAIFVFWCWLAYRTGMAVDSLLRK